MHILAECMIAEILANFGADDSGEFYLHDDQLSPMEEVFDLGEYYKKVVERSEQMLALKINFDAGQITRVILTYKVALFTEFKYFFADINDSSIAILGKSVRPRGDYMDLHELIQGTINRLGTFL
jgi:hypothetical protein